MKAITCTQCGALIEKIALKDKFARCDYCGARILLRENMDKVIDIPDRLERVGRDDSPDFIAPGPKSANSLVTGIIVISAVVIFAGGGLITMVGILFSQPVKLKDKTAAVKNTDSRKSETPLPTPLPRIVYQARVQWDGKNDMVHFENPQIEIEKLPTFETDELKKTVFRDRGVEVKVTIAATGEVVSAEALSGHPVLMEAAQNAALKTLFSSRQKPVSRVLTYYFRLVVD